MSSRRLRRMSVSRRTASVVCSFFGAMPSPCTLVISSTRKVISCVSASPSVFRPTTSPLCKILVSPGSR